MSLEQKEIPKKLSSDSIETLRRNILLKSPFFPIISMSIVALDIKNEYFTKDKKFKDDEVDTFITVGNILRLEFGKSGIIKIVDQENLEAAIYAKIISSRILLPAYILILYKDTIFIEAERVAIDYLASKEKNKILS